MAAWSHPTAFWRYYPMSSIHPPAKLRKRPHRSGRFEWLDYIMNSIPRFRRWRDIVIEVEHVRRIVLGLDCAQPIPCRSRKCLFDALLRVISEEVHVDIRRALRQRIEEL